MIGEVFLVYGLLEDDVGIEVWIDIAISWKGSAGGPAMMGIGLKWMCCDCNTLSAV